MTDKKFYPKVPNDWVGRAQTDEEMVLTGPDAQVLGIVSAVRIHPRKKAVPPPVDPPPTTDPAGWRLVWDDPFTSWDPNKYWLYGPGWRDTAEKMQAGTGGFYDPANISSDGTKLRCHLWTKNGVPSIAAFSPKGSGPDWPVNAGGWTGLRSMRMEFKLRCDKMPGFKVVPMSGWPLSDNWPMDGEIDGPEANCDATTIDAYVHVQGGRSDSKDQVHFAYPAGTSLQTEHTYRNEWLSGKSMEYFIDNVSIGKTNEGDKRADGSLIHIPNTPMRALFQFETTLDATRPDPAVSGYVELRDFKLWVPA